MDTKRTRTEWCRVMAADKEILHKRAKSLRKKIICERMIDGEVFTVYGCNEAVRLTGLPHHVIYNYLTRSRRQRGVRGWEFQYA